MNRAARDPRTTNDTATVVVWWAEHLARQLPVDDPVAPLERCGVGLHVSPEPLRARGQRLRGAWDPHLRRIELFGCHADADDNQLVETFAHELWHMLDALGRPVRPHDSGTDEYAPSESHARLFAAALCRRLTPHQRRQCAHALRARAAAPVDPRQPGFC
jgi:hypothetical protein